MAIRAVYALARRREDLFGGVHAPNEYRGTQLEAQLHLSAVVFASDHFGRAFFLRRFHIAAAELRRRAGRSQYARRYKCR